MSLRNLKPIRIAVAALILVAVVVRVAITRMDEPPRTPKPQPQVALDDFSLAESGGCGDVFLYKQSGSKVLSIQLSYPGSLDSSVDSFLRRAKQRKFVETQFDLSSPVNGLQVEIQMWDRGPRFCDCVAPPAKMTATWIAKSGKLTMTAHGPAKNLSSDCYLVSALLEDVVFEDEQGHRVTLKKETISEVGVGWYAG